MMLLFVDEPEEVGTCWSILLSDLSSDFNSPQNLVFDGPRRAAGMCIYRNEFKTEGNSKKNNSASPHFDSFATV